MSTLAAASASRSSPQLTWLPLAFLAIVVPTLLARHEPPSVTYYNQALALLGWGLWAASIASAAQVRMVLPSGWPRHGIQALVVVLLVYAAAAVASILMTGLPAGLGLMGAGMALSALVVLLVAWRAGLSDHGDEVFELACQALAVAGMVGMALALVQVFHPAWADGDWIAQPTMPGRAVGNLRQPNHFSTLLIWSCCAVAWLAARQRWRLDVAVACLVLLIGGVVFSASRTGMIGIAFLATWGLAGRQLPRGVRRTLVLAPVVYGLWWSGMWLLNHFDQGVAFAAEARLHDHSDISSSRFKIWANVLALIKAYPWHGVGYGEFNVAWTLTPFPNRPVAFFDHTHNLPLQWAVELGVPAAVLLVVLSGVAYIALARPGTPPDRRHPSPVTPAGACAVMVGLVGVHSLLEYPLWYSYFLLPTAFFWGSGLAGRAREDVPPETTTASAPRKPRHHPRLAIAAALMALGAVWSTWDYRAASNIYAPRAGAGSLEDRIHHGQGKLWFGHQADYADATGPEENEPSRPPKAFRRTLHNLVDARLMIAYARSLAEHGQVDKARFVVERLKEFRNPAGDEFLEVCDEEMAPEDLPFQCTPPKQSYDWTELLPE